MDKAIVVEDPEYLAWCRRQRCSFCVLEGRGDTLMGRVAGQAHHVIHKGMGRAEVRDDYAVPACLWDHKRCHGEVVVLAGARLLPIPRRLQFECAERARRVYLELRRIQAELDAAMDPARIVVRW